MAIYIQQNYRFLHLYVMLCRQIHPVFIFWVHLLYRAIKKMKTQSDSSLLSTVRLSRREKILEVDGTVTTQPVLEHVGISTWPGRFIG